MPGALRLTACNVMLEGVYDRVQSAAGTHGFGGQFMVGMVVTTYVHSLPLGVVKLLDDLVLVLGHLIGYWLKQGFQFWVYCLICKLLRPVQSQIEVAAPGV